MVRETETRSCLACGEILKGRVDKKFCDDYCRNYFNNRQKSNGNNSSLIRAINNSLLKNRKILASLLTEDSQKTRRDKLLEMGFQFKYLTHTYMNKAGKIYSYCYDYGYLPLGNDWFLVVKRKEE